MIGPSASYIALLLKSDRLQKGFQRQTGSEKPTKEECIFAEWQAHIPDVLAGMSSGSGMILVLMAFLML